VAAHITRLTRVKTNPLGNGMWNGNYRAGGSGRMGEGGRGIGGEKRSEREG